MSLSVPVFLDGISTDAQLARQAYGSLIGAAGGLQTAGGLAVTAKGSPTMAVLVAGGTPAEGSCWIPGTFTTSQGPYYVNNSTSYEQAIVSSGASFPRVDTIVLRVFDNTVDSSGKVKAEFEALKGKEEEGCTLLNLKGIATPPVSSLTLAYVLVPKSASSIVTADILNVATPVLPGLRALASKGSNAALPSVTKNALHLLSSERAAIVNLSWVYSGSGVPTWEIRVFAGGVQVFRNVFTSNPPRSGAACCFFLPSGQEWEIRETNSGGLEELAGSYVLL
jgi:hypothetical protein